MMLPLPKLALLLPLLGTAIAAPKPPTVKRPGLIHRRKLTGSVSSTNPGATPPTTTAEKSNVWASLSFDEAASVKAWLHQQPSLNLTAVEDAGEWDNQILTVDTLVPKKADALAYLDGDGDLPERWAHASIVFGQYEEPYVQTFRVGPLPISNLTTVTPNIEQSTAKDAKIRVHDQTPSGGYMLDTLLEVKDVMSDLLDTKIDSVEDFEENFYLFGIDPLWYEDGRVINWVQPWRLGPMNKLPSGAEFRWDDATLLPQGVYFGFDVTGRDKSQWKVLGVYYGGEFYNTLDAFRTAWQSPDFVKYKVNKGGDWSNTDKKKDAALPYDTLPPPQHIQPGGQRFEMDADAGYVKWMDFEFYTTFTRDTGLRFYDIKYKGKRIMYELGLQEAIAQYAGQDPVQSGVSYLDSYYGFGPYAFNLVPGYDVPTYASCMKAVYHEGEESISHDCGITFFEMDLGYPMSRHTTGDYVSVTKNIALVFVGNYDYEFDYTLMLDGTIEVLGYIQSAFYAKNDGYGYKIHDALSGSMHDHILNFKADIDILGTDNTMVKHVFEPIETTYPWSNVTKSTMHLARKEVETEDEGKMNWSPNAREKVIIVNKDAKNKYGEEPGYLMMPSRGGGMYTTTPNNTNLGNSQEFAKFAYYLTKYKDSEIHATSPWNAYDPWNPLINFGDYLDGESLVQEDLVWWFNLGMHHVPHTGDLPNTVFTTAQSAMVFTPHNYLLGDASRDSSQTIRINFDEEKATDVETFGSEPITGTVNLEQVAWNPYNYYGDLTTRKFPYDGLNKESSE